MEFIINSLDDLPKVSQEIIAHITHSIICFEGEMGAGKTTFIKQLVKDLGVDDLVSSPTFSLVNEYQTNNKTIYHFDCYRLNSEEEAYDFGIEDYLYGTGLCLIEWPSKIASLIPEEHHVITILQEDEKRRLIFE